MPSQDDPAKPKTPHYAGHRRRLRAEGPQKYPKTTQRTPKTSKMSPKTDKPTDRPTGGDNPLGQVGLEGFRRGE